MGGSLRILFGTASKDPIRAAGDPVRAARILFGPLLGGSTGLYAQLPERIQIGRATLGVQDLHHGSVGSPELGVPLVGSSWGSG